MIDLLLSLASLLPLMEIEDWQRLPSHQECYEKSKIGENFLVEVRERRKLLPAWLAVQLDDVEQDAVRCKEFWDAGMFTRSSDATTRRESVEMMKAAIGPPAWYAGLWPPAIPYWHLPRED